MPDPGADTDLTPPPAATPTPRLIDPSEATAIAAALAPLLPAPLVPLFDESFIRSCGLFDEFVLRLAAQVFRAAGLEKAAREPGTTEEIATRAGLEGGRAIAPLDWILRRLAVSGLVAEGVDRDGRRRFGVREPFDAADPAPIRDVQLQYDPSWRPSYVLAETVAQDYPAFLRGEAAGERVLFSPARFTLWFDYFSNDNRLYAVNNGVGAIAVTEWLPRGDHAVLELGGGLGSGTAALLERLDAGQRLGEIRQYRFTELVPAFMRRGQRALESRFGGVSPLTFGQLDMNRAFDDQGIAAGSVSLAYAVNTVHVAHDLDFTLAEVFRALEPGGRLILSECVRPYAGQPIHVEFIFNLMETFRSPRLHPVHRPNGGFLTPEEWKSAIEAAGFVDVRFLPDIARVRESLPEFCVAAIGAVRPA